MEERIQNEIQTTYGNRVNKGGVSIIRRGVETIG